MAHVIIAFAVLAVQLDAFRSGVVTSGISRDDANWGVGYGAAVSPWFNIEVRRTQCLQPSFQPFKLTLESQLSVGASGDIWKQLVADARDVAKHHNCRLCDIVAKGNRDGSLQKGRKVTCSIDEDPLLHGKADACLTGNGDVEQMMTVTGKADRCMPCPTWCKECRKTGSLLRKFSRYDFKCILKTEIMDAAPFRCTGCIKAKIKKEIQLQTWCKFGNLNKHDFLKDLTEEETSATDETPVGLTATVKVNALTCDSSALSTSMESSAGGTESWQSIFQAVSPRMLQFAKRANCRMCALELTAVEGALPEVDDALQISCATDEFSEAACSRNLGPVGWSRNQPCAPCPRECGSCKDKSQGTFECNVMPTEVMQSPLFDSEYVKSTKIKARGPFPVNYSCVEAAPIRPKNELDVYWHSSRYPVADCKVVDDYTAFNDWVY